LSEPVVEPHYVNSRLSKSFGELIGYLLAKDSHHRYRTPSDMVADMKSVVQRGAPFVARETIPKPVKG
ncbi:MAG: hypothetical protein HY000_17725, partial [Planctomycetes bacterium]|nr:hypothetical protein [Planctomycetota bacterium]